MSSRGVIGFNFQLCPRVRPERSNVKNLSIGVLIVFIDCRIIVYDRILFFPVPQSRIVELAKRIGRIISVSPGTFLSFSVVCVCKLAELLCFRMHFYDIVELLEIFLFTE